MADRSNTTKLRTGEGNWIGPEELQDVLADEGYSAGERKQFLKSVLTEMAQAEARHADNPQGREELLAEVRRILSEERDRHVAERNSGDD